MKKRLTKDEISKIILAFNEKKPELQIWLDNVSSLLKNSPSLNKLEPYTIKSRVKDEASLRKKIQEKHDIENRPITPETLFHEIEDLAGIRIVLDYKTLVFKAVECLEDLEKANKIRIKERTDYIWHPEEVKIVEASGGIVSTKESGYCSRHFILCPPNMELDDDEIVKCEVQIRTLIEEAIFQNVHKSYKLGASRQKNQVLKRLIEILETSDMLLDDIYNIKIFP